MTGDTILRGPADQLRIDLTDPEEAAWWVKKLGAQLEKFQSAIDQSGTSP